ncbi:hypothetical protein DICSQDRAFT_86616 [Dichomitus squalens LYAD-421 SS1]|uniref:CID domain-containing protein n=1 Tax=Dichomitus squalens (strain LYAD-421) TaxID=732165 RepID=R7SZQ9_DICSQ|nr:uncharacterized protein DICSQDRAFT_86616 [Dichomitus squalens LYAD-421 SS1]EJF61180.1 hypothetical protein DICSQDRAFT_86616 [Dichomitus squalens LYAD-421 SS1]
MSLYPQTTTYTQMPYPAQGYGAAVPPQPSYYPPPPAPQPVFHLDPNMFRRDYMTRLANLTVNSRPIIQTLSLIAQDYSRYADVVVQCIEQHIRRVPPWMKLPSFYLLDAISKNVYDPYARHFTPIVVRLFLDTYEVVDQQTRSKMEEMLLTWRTASPTGRELFGVVSQLAIERHIWGGDSTQNAQSGSRDSGSISQAQVLSELEFVLGQKERLLLSSPHDDLTKHHIGILQQLRGMVQVGVPQRDLQAILTQLRALTTPSPPPAPAPQPYGALPSYSPPPSITGRVIAPQPPYQSQPAYPVNYEQPKQEAMDISRFLHAAAPVASTSTTPSVSMPDISGIFSALLKAGVVSASSTSTGAGASSKHEEPNEPADPERQARRAYRKLILSTKIKLTSSDVTRQRPRITDILYDRLPTQCKQCGYRFSDNSVGKKLFEEHLDMHFRQNRKATQAVGRGHSRSWFVSLEDWVSADSGDSKGKGRADGRTVSSKAVAAKEAAKREAELRAMFVVVPPGDEAKAISCPICKEPLKSEFLEDDEEWVWRNAVKKDDRIYHATCHAEAIASKSNLAVRLLGEGTSRSRSKTPEKATPPRAHATSNGELRQSETPTPSKLAGMKRKAEDDHATAVKHEGDGPQAKRVAT